MHWSATHATKFTRLTFLVNLALLWFVKVSAAADPLMITRLMGDSFQQMQQRSGMFSWCILSIVILLSLMAIYSLVRSARIQQKEGVSSDHIRHSLGADLLLAIAGLALAVSLTFGQIEGVTGEVVVGVGFGTLVLAGIIGNYSLYRASLPEQG